MRIAYLVPGPMHLTEMGAAEMDRRRERLRSWAFEGTEVDVVSVERGPATIESIYEEYLTLVPGAQRIRELERSGYDAVIIGCFGDPGLDGYREIVDMLVVGPASASMALAATLGNRFGIVTVTESIVHSMRRLAWDTGVLDALAAVRFIDTPVLEVHKNRETAVEKMVDEGRRAIDDGADTLVLGCMTMGFLDVAEDMSTQLGVPVVNPAGAALKFAEATVSVGLSHSRRAYFTPPKVSAGQSIDELLVEGDLDIGTRAKTLS